MSEHIDIIKCSHCGESHSQLEIVPNAGGETLKGTDMLLFEWKVVCPTTGKGLEVIRISEKDAEVLRFHGLTPESAWLMLVEALKGILDKKEGTDNGS